MDVDILWAASVNGELAATGLMTMTTSLIQTAPSTHVHINAGGDDYFDGEYLWEADTNYVNTGSKYCTTSSIANTDYPALYQSEQWDPVNGEDLPQVHLCTELEDSLYNILQIFAEIYSSAMGDGLRVFDVMVQGMESILLEGIEMYKAAGSQGNTA
jgi:hypothetical protein